MSILLSYRANLKKHGMKLLFTNYIGILITGFLLLTINSIGFTLWVTQLWASLKSAFFKATGQIAVNLFQLMFTQGLSSNGIWQLIINQKTLFEPIIWPLIYLLIALGLLNLLISSFHIAGIYSITNQAVCKQKASILSYFKKGFSKFFPVFILFLLIVILTLPFLAFAGWIDFLLLQAMTDGFTWQSNGFMWFLGILFAVLILLIFVIILMQLTIFAPAALFAEKIGPIRALVRSFRHVFFSFRRVSLTVIQLLCLYLLTGAFVLTLNSPALFTFIEPIVVGPLANIWNFLVNLVILPIILAGISTLANLLLLQRYHRYLISHSSEEKQDTDPSIKEDSFKFSLENNQSTET